jgi:hypothetical protein
MNNEHLNDEWTDKELGSLTREIPKGAPKVSEHISTVETAKLIRVQLKNKFPGVKFSVKSDQYSMGSSIRINWTDGPVTKAVEEVVNPFCGGRFDGMIDLAYNVDSWLLPDGSAAFGKSAGTGTSRGSDSAYDHPAPCEGARMVSFSPDHIFCSRSFSEIAMLKAVLAVHEKFGLPLLNVEMTQWGPQLKGDLHARIAPHDSYDNRDRVHQELQEMVL